MVKWCIHSDRGWRVGMGLVVEASCLTSSIGSLQLRERAMVVTSRPRGSAQVERGDILSQNKFYASKIRLFAWLRKPISSNRTGSNRTGHAFEERLAICSKQRSTDSHTGHPRSIVGNSACRASRWSCRFQTTGCLTRMIQDGIFDHFLNIIPAEKTLFESAR